MYPNSTQAIGYPSTSGTITTSGAYQEVAPVLSIIEKDADAVADRLHTVAAGLESQVAALLGNLPENPNAVIASQPPASYVERISSTLASLSGCAARLESVSRRLTDAGLGAGPTGSLRAR